MLTKARFYWQTRQVQEQKNTIQAQKETIASLKEVIKRDTAQLLAHKKYFGVSRDLANTYRHQLSNAYDDMSKTVYNAIQPIDVDADSGPDSSPVSVINQLPPARKRKSNNA